MAEGETVLNAAAYLDNVTHHEDNEKRSHSQSTTQCFFSGWTFRINTSIARQKKTVAHKELATLLNTYT